MLSRINSSAVFKTAKSGAIVAQSQANRVGVFLYDNLVPVIKPAKPLKVEDNYPEPPRFSVLNQTLPLAAAVGALCATQGFSNKSVLMITVLAWMGFMGYRGSMKKARKSDFQADRAMYMVSTAISAALIGVNLGQENYIGAALSAVIGAENVYRSIFPNDNKVQAISNVGTFALLALTSVETEITMIPFAPLYGIPLIKDAILPTLAISSAANVIGSAAMKLGGAKAENAAKCINFVAYSSAAAYMFINGNMAWSILIMGIAGKEAFDLGKMAKSYIESRRNHVSDELPAPAPARG